MATLEDRVRSWLTNQGYPLEMRVARIAGEEGAGWDHGRVYDDPLTGKTREIDLVAYFDPPRSRRPSLAVHVVFECKHTRDKPWVLFCSERPMLTPLGFVLSTPATLKAAAGIRITTAGSLDLTSLDIFRPPGNMVGFNLVRAHTDNQDTAYHAVRGVTTAAMTTANLIGKSGGHSVLYPPVIVIDSPLLQCRLTESGEDVDLQRVDRGMLVHSSNSGVRTPIHVVTIEALPEFMRMLAKDSKYLRAVVPYIEYEPDLPTD